MVVFFLRPKLGEFGDSGEKVGFLAHADGVQIGVLASSSSLNFTINA